MKYRLTSEGETHLRAYEDYIDKNLFEESEDTLRGLLPELKSKLLRYYMALEDVRDTGFISSNYSNAIPGLLDLAYIEPDDEEVNKKYITMRAWAALKRHPSWVSSKEPERRTWENLTD